MTRPDRYEAEALLRDDTLKAQAAGVPEDRVAVAPEVLAEPDAAVVAIRSQELAERRFPLGQRRISEVEAIHEEQIERIEGEVARTAPQSFDQRPEAPSASLGQCNDFAVDQPRFQGEGGGRLGDRFEPLGPVEALPGAHGDAAVGDVELHPVAVIFDLVQPVRAGRRLVHGGREAGCDKGRELAWFRIGQVGRIENRLPPLAACRLGRDLALPGGPDAVLIAGDLLHRSAGRDGTRHLGEDIRRVGGSRRRILGLEQEPRRLLLAWLWGHADEVPEARELLARELRI